MAKKPSAAVPQIEAEGDGVLFSENKESCLVSFPFNSSLVGMIRRVEGAAFDKAGGHWVIPQAKRDELVKLVPELRKQVGADRDAAEAIVRESMAAAKERQQKEGAAETVHPQVTDYHERGKETTGEIIAANSHYVAQLTGFGKKDGAAFVVLHRRSDMDEELFKGDKAAITYDDKFHAKARRYLSQEDQEHNLATTLGAAVDGVKVTKTKEGYQVEFEYNDTLRKRITDIHEATFNQDTKIWTVGSDKTEFLARAVNDMRHEVVADRKDREALSAVAEGKITNAKVKDAYTKEGAFHTGEILAQSSRYVLQHTGKEYTALHRKDNLQSQVRDGDNVRIEYKGGKGTVKDRTKDKVLER